MNSRWVDFQVFTRYGGGDSVDWEISIQMTDEEYERLENAARDGNDFRDAKEVCDLYDKVHTQVVAQATADMIKNDPESVEEYLKEGQTIEEWSADKVYSFGIDYPRELCELYEEEEEDWEDDEE